jgi:2-oxoisovalerate dehydrogenase E1 component
VGILDLRSLYPLDEELLYSKVREYNRVLVVTEEPVHNSFAQSLAGRIQEECFISLDAPVRTLGSANLPAIPLNEILEKTMLPNETKVSEAIRELLDW